MDRWMGKENVVYTYGGISFSLEKEGCHLWHHNESERHYAKWKKPDIEGQILHDATVYIRNLK